MPTLHILGGKSFIGENVGRYIGNTSAGSLDVTLYNRNDIDLLDPRAVDSFFQHVHPQDSVLVAAAISRLTDNSYQCFKQNCDIAENIAQAIRTSTCRHLIYLSSIDVYGQQTKHHVLSEQSALAPEDYYSSSKLAGENILSIALQDKPQCLCILRLTGIYGPGDSGKSLIGLFVNRLRNKQRITLFAGGTSLRDYVYVDDLAELILNTITYRHSGLFNVATGVSATIREIAETVQSVMAIEENQLDFSSDTHRNYDLCFNTQKLTEKFPSVQFRTIKQGISHYLESL